MALTESLQAQALRELKSDTCFCGEAKKPRESFCKRCYYLLPANTRKALYRPFSDGYATLYDEAKDTLKIEHGIAGALGGRKG